MVFRTMEELAEADRVANIRRRRNWQGIRPQFNSDGMMKLSDFND